MERIEDKMILEHNMSMTGIGLYFQVHSEGHKRKLKYSLYLKKSLFIID